MSSVFDGAHRAGPVRAHGHRHRAVRRGRGAPGLGQVQDPF